ncbi:CLUMA_CG000997, isoform A [Clunio marinus]|uniref:CLUMA_CG000997, isoform A n=1 Tax=Clunio marinus TaxID=568069 RepID=A0A1J1HGP8_9DIPT|nr:CLUMA_CG000997, isoform A [Clunio marinus]
MPNVLLNFTRPTVSISLASEALNVKVYCGIFFLEKENSINKIILSDKVHRSGYYVIILEIKNRKSLKNIFKVFWKNFFFNINVLGKEKVLQNISLFTFLPFNGAICGDVSPVIINEFNENYNDWSTNEYFPKKLKNLNQCPIRIGSHSNPPAVIDRNESSVNTYGGNMIDFVRMLSSVLNFKIDFHLYSVGAGAFANGTATGLMEKAYSNDVDLIIGLLSLQQIRMEYLSETRAFYHDDIILVVPPPPLIPSIRKLFMPLDFYCWVALLLILLISSIILTILKILPKSYHNLVIGENIKNQYLNILEVLFGESQKKLPVKNFPRFILMSFMVFCLIMRTCYTGSLFNILKNDISSKKIKSIEELNQMDYKFIIYDTLAARLNDKKFMKREVISYSKVEEYCRMTLDPSFKGAVFGYHSTISYQNLLNRKEYSVNILQEPLVSNQIVSYFTKNFYMVNEFNEKISQFKASGLINFWISKYFNEDGEIDQDMASSITLKHFSGIFTIYIYGLICSLIAFIIELISKRTKQRRQVTVRRSRFLY